MTYVKVFGSILDSTIWQGSLELKVVWMTMLAMKDHNGIVEASIPGLAKRAGVSIQAAEEVLAALLGPDPYSRTKEHDGRRIEEVDGGWRVLNHFKYRDKHDADEQRARVAARVAKHRERAHVTPCNGPSVTVTVGNARNASVTPSDQIRSDPDHADPVGGAGSRPEADPDPESGRPVSASGSAAVVPSAITGPVHRAYPAKQPPHPPGGSAVAGVLDGPSRRTVLEVPATVSERNRGVVEKTGGAAGQGIGPPSHARDPVLPGAVYPDPELIARQKLGDWVWNELNAIRARLALERGWRDVKALHPMDPGRTELAERLRETGAAGEDLARHVLAIAEADAKFRGTAEYLNGGMFEPRSWAKKVSMRVADVVRDRARASRAPEYAGSRVALERERATAQVARAHETPPPIEVDMTPEDRAELTELARRVGHDPIAAAALERAETEGGES